MITSAQETLSNEQAITATAVSTNVLDLAAAGTPHDGAGALNRDVGKGHKIPFTVQVTEDFNNLTSLTVTLQKDTVEAFSSAETVIEHTMLLADLVAGARVPGFEFLPEGCDQQYIRLNYTVTGTAPTTGKIFAAVSMGNQSNITG